MLSLKHNPVHFQEVTRIAWEQKCGEILRQIQKTLHNYIEHSQVHLAMPLALLKA